MHTIHWHEVVRPGEAFHAARNVRRSRNPVALHGHDFAEVFWINAGHARHRVNGRDVELLPRTLVLMRPPDRHAIEPRDDALEFTNIAFPRETWRFLQRRYFSQRQGAFWTGGVLPTACQVEPAQIALFDRWADQLAQRPRERLHIERFLLDLLSELEGHRERRPDTAMPDWLALTCEEIRKPEHFAGGAPSFLRLAGRSREHVARCCREFLGVTPTQYVNRVRMAHAARQLEMSTRTILDVALDCGVQNLSHFYTLFREAYGISPRAYRLQHRKLL